MVTAAAANKQMQKELLQYNVLYSDIKKGESAYGIIGIQSGGGYAPLSVRLKTKP